MSIIRRLIRHGRAFAASVGSGGPHKRSVRHVVPDCTCAWPPVARRIGIGETTEWLPLDHHISQGRPAMVRPYLVAHERATASAQREGLGTPVGVGVR